MNGKQKKANKAPRAYLPSVEIFGEKPEKNNGGSHRKVYRGSSKQRKLGKKLWRDWYKSTEFIRKMQ